MYWNGSITITSKEPPQYNSNIRCIEMREIADLKKAGLSITVTLDVLKYNFAVFTSIYL